VFVLEYEEDDDDDSMTWRWFDDMKTMENTFW